MKSESLRFATIMACAVFTASGQDNRVAGPVLGYVFDSGNHSIRVIHGVPGAAVTGPALDLKVEIGSAVFAASSDWALATAEDGRRVAILRNLAGAADVVWLPDAAPKPDQIAINPGGGSAALYSREQNAAQLLKGLPQAPSIAANIDLSSIGSEISVWAVSDDAAHILVSSGEGGSDRLYLVDAGGNAKWIVSVGRASAAILASNGRDIVVADGLKNAVYWVRDVEGTSEVVPLAGEQDGIAGPVALNISGDKQRVLVANADSRTIAALPLAGGPPELTFCRCKPEKLDRLGGNDVFLLTEGAADPLWIFDSGAPESRVLFIPAGEKPAEGGLQ
ncbi:MAG: hypothetical protein M1541_08780 [Acidobacteria bacterium]|nr:hypothetical protein [Acidobacteriota bacterium]